MAHVTLFADTPGFPAPPRIATVPQRRRARARLLLALVCVLALPAAEPTAGGAGGRSRRPAPASRLSARPSASGRSLVDQNNAPFLMVGDAPQSLIGNLSPG